MSVGPVPTGSRLVSADSIGSAETDKPIRLEGWAGLPFRSFVSGVSKVGPRNAKIVASAALSILRNMRDSDDIPERYREVLGRKSQVKEVAS